MGETLLQDLELENEEELSPQGNNEHAGNAA